jgi:hypothetical protein
MPTRAFSTLVTELAPSVPGCPEATMIQYIRRAAIDACRRTLMWRYDAPTITLVAGTTDYSFSPPSDTVVCAVLSALMNNAPIATPMLEDAIAQYPQWTTQDGEPRLLCQVSLDRFVPLPTPDAQKPYVVRMIYALEPTPTATGMDEVVLNELDVAIVHKALQDLLVLPKVFWEDRDLAAYHARQYMARLAEKRAKANLGTFRSAVSVQMRPFA